MSPGSSLPDPPQEPHGHGADEPFPRERLTELLGEAEAARERRERAQVWLIGVGAAIVALGLPTERLWGGMELVRRTAGSGEPSYGILFPIAVALKELSGLSAEQVCFLIAAISYGLCVPALAALLRTIGFGRGIALASGLTALFAAGPWLGATMPGDFAPGILGATLLLRTLFQPRERLRNGYQWRATLLLALAFLLRPENMLLFPAVAWAVTRHRGRGRMPGLVPAFALALVTGFSLWVLMSGPRGPSHWWHLLDTLLAGREPSLAHLPGWVLWLVGGFGVGLFGVYVLLFGRRLPEETPAPKWMVPWCLVVLAPVVGGSAAAGPVGCYLVPAAAVGLADWLTRRGREEAGVRWGAILLAAQVVATVLLVGAWRLGDPLREWRWRARAALEPTDVVGVVDARRAYLLAQRWQIATWRPDPSAAVVEPPAELAEQDAGEPRRVVLVGHGGAAGAGAGAAPWPPPGSVLHPERDTWVLTRRELVRVPAGERYSPP